mgnify:CR=1 FL=1
MARTVRNHPVPRDKMQEERGAEQIPEVKTQEISVGLYIRLSKEDSGKHNQNTVENQKALLEDFVRSKADMKVFDVYIDNGFSGTNFERPAFQKMMEDAKSGKINCIIVKDLSRFGRSYLEIGNYLEKIFPFLNIRFISVTDHFDTFAAASSESGRPLTNGLEIPLKNIINEVYAKDISRKVGSAIEIKKKEGRYGGGVAPYGYRKSKTVKGKYEVDEEAPSAEVRLNGKKQKQLFTSDFCVCSAENVQDDTEGEVQIQWYLAREKLDDGQITQKQGEWREGKQIEIQEEGIWYPYVKLTDAFGNARYLPVGKVVIDRTSPEIVIQGMPQNQILLSDYKVKISLEEFYLNQKKSYIKLYKRTGKSAKEEQLLDMSVNWKKGKAELKDKKSSGSNTGESGDDVYLKDGWYRLKIYAEDLAGNRKEQEICFAVNRSGPKLTTDASMQKFLKQKTAQRGWKLKFRVWDVNKMQKEELQCIFDGKARNLEEGKDYQKKSRSTAEGFTEYDYEVSEAVFEKEGRYSLKLFLEDEAGHRLSEKEKTLCRDFAVDRTPPICVIDPIKATEKGFQVQTICEDNIDFAKILLYKNGSLYKESKNQKSSWEISFGHGEKWQLEVFDTAGNKEVRYLLKEELQKELERKKLLPEKKGKHKNRVFETQKQTENGTHGEKQKKAGFLQKEMDPLSNETKEQEQNQKKGEEQGAAALIVVLCSLCILMMGKYRIQEKI